MQNENAPAGMPIAKPFSLEEVRLNQNFDELVAVKSVTINVPVKRPPQQQFFQINPDPAWRVPLPLLELKEDEETYLVDRSMCAALANEITPRLVVACMTRGGNAYLWPIGLPDAEGRLNSWHEAAMKVVQGFAGKWIRVKPNRDTGGYDVIVAGADGLAAPVWPECGLAGLVETAFQGKIISDANHVVIRRLRGLV